MPKRLLSFVLLAIVVGCARRGSDGGAVVFQNSTIDALLDGNYDGELSPADLKRQAVEK